jgi:hypothetical protein
VGGEGDRRGTAGQGKALSNQESTSRATRVILLLLPAALLPASLWAQKATFGPTITQILTSGDGISRRCYQSEHSTGFGGRVAVPVLTSWTTLQVAGRGYWVGPGSSCATADIPPRLDGTYVEEYRINLLSQDFITTDLRLAARLGDLPMDLALGGGNAWREGYNLPYLLASAGISLFERPNGQLRLETEYQWLRVTSDQVRRTYQDFQLIAEEPLGRVRHWSHALALGLAVNLPF